MLGGILFLLLAIGAMVALPIILTYIGMANETKLVVATLRWPVLFVAVALMLALLYRFGPNRQNPHWRWITWGSAFAAITWLAASALFSWYAANFGTFNKTYGSLGAIIGFMMWMWLSIIVVLVGGKLNAEIEHQTVRQSTAGQLKPLGRRGAKMADTIGPAHA